MSPSTCARTITYHLCIHFCNPSHNEFCHHFHISLLQLTFILNFHNYHHHPLSLLLSGPTYATILTPHLCNLFCSSFSCLTFATYFLTQLPQLPSPSTFTVTFRSHLCNYFNTTLMQSILFLIFMPHSHRLLSEPLFCPTTTLASHFRILKPDW